MSQEWTWAAAVIAVPFMIFGAIELANLMRRRRSEAVARRQKGVRRASSGSGRGRTG